jgi:hypothetical protein
MPVGAPSRVILTPDQFNQMKVNAQLEGKPTLRNIAKLLIYSMYERFGMHVDQTMHKNSRFRRSSSNLFYLSSSEYHTFMRRIATN